MPLLNPQPELFSFKPDDPNVAWLETVLKDAGRWMSVSEISTASAGRLKDREIRALASASPWVLSAPGSPGYAHLAKVPSEEQHHWISAGLRQAQQMTARYERLRQNAHRLIA